MRKTTLVVAAAAALALLPGVASASHIVVSVLTGVPAGSGTNVVNFQYTEKESTLCCSGGPTIEFGDGSTGYLDAVSLNQDAPAGDYEGTLYDGETGEMSPLPYHVAHLAEPPLPEGKAYNTEVTFSHHYPAATTYTVVWSDCCAGAPDIAEYVPYEIRSALGPAWYSLIAPALYQVQSPVQDAWYQAVTPAVEGVQNVSPAGISGGTGIVAAM